MNFPTDGTVNPGHAALAFAKGAVDAGARVVQGATVTGFVRRGARVVGIVTDRGSIDAEHVVLASGLWTSELARLAGVSVSLYPAEHVWVMTEETDGALEQRPFLRDLDGYLYVRHYRGRYLIGAFEPNGKPKRPDDVPTTGFAEFGEDWDHFAPVLANARHRLPELEAVGFGHYLRAPESFTPDANFQLGAFPEAPGLWVAAGLNSQGVIFGPGVGRALSEWIVEGHPTMDLVEVDVARHGSVGEQPGVAPRQDRRDARPAVRDALALTAVVRRAGRATYAVARPPPRERRRGRRGGGLGARRVVRAWRHREPAWGYDFDRPSWHGPVGDEVQATRERRSRRCGSGRPVSTRSRSSRRRRPTPPRSS